MNKILILGTVAFDTIETPHGKEDRVLGGSASYIGLSASQFDLQTSILSIVGDDFNSSFLNIFKSKNIDVTSIQRVIGEKTFFWSGRYSSNMNERETISTELNVLANFDPQVPESFKNADILVLGNLAPSNQLSVINQLTNPAAFVVLDTMNFWMDNCLDDLLQVIRNVDIITINEEEARQLSGETSLSLAAKKIFNMGPSNIVIKKGEHGALLFSDNKRFFVPAFPIEKVFDPTGAGDTFLGGFAGYLAKTKNYSFKNMKKAVVYGCLLASFSVEKFGTKGLLNLDKVIINKRMQLFKRLIKDDM
tara:strand:- start:22341 stop:23258 length:918 start_codon:yes stop_codon:yes gene_type:complete